MANGGPGQPWPVSQEGHSAVSLYDSDSNPSNPTLMVMWGQGDGVILNDWWLFGVNAQHWRKVRVYPAHHSAVTTKKCITGIQCTCIQS